MAKKNSPKEKDKKPSPPLLSAEIRGFLLLAVAGMLFLSLLSFAYGHHSQNWLGLVGYTVGFILHVALGLCSYLTCGYLAWIGWRNMMSKPIQQQNTKNLFFCLFISSLCILLSLIEDVNPPITASAEKIFYAKWPQQIVPYHLGGAIFDYLYDGIPEVNLQRIFNTIGVGIIFSSTLIASLLYFSEITFAQVLGWIRSAGTAIKNAWPKPKEENKDVVANDGSPAKKPEKSSVDFLRYVKLRMPDQPQSNPNPSTPPQGSRQDLLAIQPETDLIDRPSLSRKDQSEKLKPKPAPLPSLNSEFDAPKKKTPDSAPSSQGSPLPSSVKREAALAAQQVHNGDFTNYQLPSSNLLTNPKKFDQSIWKKDLKKQAEVLEETLQSFGIEAKVGQINCGPTITSFEVHPAIGVKVQKIKTLEDDIALNMEAKSIRIIAPIPGKAAVGIEVPNQQPQEVSFKELLTAYQQGTQKLRIPLLLGKAVNGDYVMSDLAKMPHCIIAGATGSGKSVCINTIVMSIVHNAKPDQIQLLMVDPKKVELTPYSNLPHMIAPVITEPHGAYTALKWLVKEMENRYELLKHLGVRNIDSFNSRTINKEVESNLKMPVPATLPYIVGIIDELADLMMASSSDIETPIARIAQMARAVGIHLILATQRPSREVITGLIKANFPARISFKVASRVNSQIVLDEVGAETLLGNGDMLFLPPGTSQLLRVQGAYIRDEDIHSVVKAICDQAPPRYRIHSFDSLTGLEDHEGSSMEKPESTGDVMYDQALEIVTSTGNASTTFLQRKLKIGYARAASLMDQLETRGIVSPADGSKARKVLITRHSENNAPEIEVESFE